MSPMLVESPRLQSSSVTGRSLRLIALGGICGLAWSASLRGWMTQLAGTESSFYLDGDLPPRPLAGRPGRRVAWLGGGPAPVVRTSPLAVGGSRAGAVHHRPHRSAELHRPHSNRNGVEPSA